MLAADADAAEAVAAVAKMSSVSNLNPDPALMKPKPRESDQELHPDVKPHDMM